MMFCLIYLFCLSGSLLLPKKSNNCPRMQQNSLTLDKHTKKICINKSLPFKSIVNSSWKHTSKIKMGIKHCSTNFNNFIFFISQLYWSEWYCQRKITRKKKDKRLHRCYWWQWEWVQGKTLLQKRSQHAFHRKYFSNMYKNKTSTEVTACWLSTSTFSTRVVTQTRVALWYRLRKKSDHWSSLRLVISQLAFLTWCKCFL